MVQSGHCPVTPIHPGALAGLQAAPPSCRSLATRLQVGGRRLLVRLPSRLGNALSFFYCAEVGDREGETKGRV
jgi:hypothetical protein